MCEHVRMQEIALCFSKLKFMDVGYIAIPSIFLLLLEKHSGERDVNSRQQGHKPGFQANM